MELPNISTTTANPDPLPNLQQAQAQQAQVQQYAQLLEALEQAMSAGNGNDQASQQALAQVLAQVSGSDTPISPESAPSQSQISAITAILNNYLTSSGLQQLENEIDNLANSTSNTQLADACSQAAEAATNKLSTSDCAPNVTPGQISALLSASSNLFSSQT